MDAHAVEVGELPVVRHGLTRPEPAQQGDRLVGARPALADGHATGRELRRVLAAHADPEGHAAAGGAIEVGDLLGDDRGRVEGEEQDGGADAHTLRAAANHASATIASGDGFG